MMIHEGLLWFDADPKKPLATKLREAVARYTEKYSVVPNACQLSPAYESEVAVLERPPLPVQYSRFIRPHYIYVGVDETLPHVESNPVVTAAAERAAGSKSAAAAPRGPIIRASRQEGQTAGRRKTNA